MKQLILALSLAIFICFACGDSQVNQNSTDSGFGWSDVKETAKTTKDRIVVGAHKVGDWISEKAHKAKDKVVSGYEYLKVASEISTFKREGK
jgi:hypothetical protein